MASSEQIWWTYVKLEIIAEIYSAQIDSRLLDWNLNQRFSAILSKSLSFSVIFSNNQHFDNLSMFSRVQRYSAICLETLSNVQ